MHAHSRKNARLRIWYTVYKATVTTSNTNNVKHYIGMTASTFKERYRNHNRFFNHKKYSNDSELSGNVFGN
jgi:hypothetical protein